MPDWYRWEGEDLILRLRVQPRASADGFAGPYGDRMKLRITAPPVDGAANRHLCRWLAKRCRVPASAVRVVRGEQGRDKEVRIAAPAALPEGVTPAAG